MNLPWLERIGVRLGLAVAGVLFLLAFATHVLTNLAFERSARSVQEASTQQLGGLTRSTLLEIAELEAQGIANSLERAATAGRTAADYLSRRMEESSDTDVPLPLAEVASGHWLDPDPARRSTLHVPSTRVLRASALRDARASLVLDELLPSLTPELEVGVSIFYVNPDGVIRYHPPIESQLVIEPDYDITAYPVYMLGTPEENPERGTRWTPPFLDDAGNGLLVTVITPVYANGEFRGVIDVDVSLTRLAARLAHISPLPGSLTLLFDRQGRLITASPGATRLLGSYAPDLAFGTPLNLPELAGMLAHVREGRSGIATLEALDDPIVLAHAPLSGTGWTLAIGVPASAVDAPARLIAAGIAAEARRAQRGNAFASLIAFLLALGVLVVATRQWVVTPIASLAAGTRRLGAGELGTDLALGSRGEFRVLSEAFNRMSHTLAHQRGEILEHQRDLQRQVTERTRELGNLLAISTDLGAATDAHSLMHTVLLRLREAVPFDRGGIWLIEGTDLRRIAAVAPETAPSRAPLPASILAEFLPPLAQRQPVRLASLTDGHPMRCMLDADAASMLLVPLKHHGRLSGVLVLADPRIGETHQVDLAVAVAQQLGTVLDNARLLLQARERSALEERQHLARELHDSVSQALFGVVLGLQTAQKELKGPGRLRTAVEYAYEMADAALKEMRALIFELRPEALEVEGLTGLLRRQAEMLQARHDIEVDLEAVEPSLPVEAKAVLYRVAQEALHNVVKHAHATAVQVTLEEGSGAVLLEVRDDGRGFVKGEQSAESFGLHSMQERMALLGGRLEVNSGLGAGTRIVAHLPLARIAASAEGAAS